VGSGLSVNAEVQYFYTYGTPGRNLTLTVSMTGSNVESAGTTFIFYDISGAASSPLDTSNTASGTQSTGGNLGTVSITPSTAAGLVLGQVGIAFNTVTGLTTSPGQFHSGTFVTESNNAHDDQNNGWAGVYNPNTNAITFTWAQNNHDQTGVGAWAAMAVAFKAASTSFGEDGFCMIPCSGFDQRSTVF
jgi:hypothetical protein